MSKAIIPSPAGRQRLAALQAELAEAHEALRLAEADLAREQAAINAFRLQCRLKIGDQVDVYLQRHAERQAAVTRLALWRQAEDLGILYDADDPFWQGEAEAPEPPSPEEEGIILPTDTPRDKAAEKRLYRQLARRFHPDLGANAVERAYGATMMAAINEAYSAGNIAALRDMAGELDPEMVASLTGGETAEIRRVGRLLLACRRRQRRVARQARTLHEENTARLWRRAQRLEAEGLNWWDEVRLELERAAARLEAETAVLREAIRAFEATD